MRCVNVIRIGCIVEGHGDDTAVPVVVRRVASVELPAAVVVADTMIRRDRGRMVQQRQLATDVELVARKLGGQDGVLVVLDADDDCPASLGPQMQQWAQSARPDVPIGVVLAMREFESWFLASTSAILSASADDVMG